MSTSVPPSAPKVIIVGAGIGGLTLALLLEKAGISYEILERATNVKPLGSALSLGENIAPLFRQLGIYEEFKKIAKVNKVVVMRDEHAQHDYTMDFSARREFGGADLFIVARPALFNLLKKHIPKERVHMNKKVISTHQDEHHVRVECADGSFFEGHILVGADGAYSSVRQEMFKELKGLDRLPLEDDEPLPFNCVCLVGQTRILDVNEFPDLKNVFCAFNSMCATGNPYSWVTFSTTHNTLCWMVTKYLDGFTSKQSEGYNNAEWGPEAAEAMCNEVRDFVIPNGPTNTLTLGVLIDKTDKDLISKVMLEEKVFKTWYSGRIVLLGDACHKLSPSGGVGAMSAIHDALCLANWIYVLRSTSVNDTEDILREYQEERYPIAVGAFKKSQLFGTINQKTFVGSVARFIRRRMPNFLWLKILRESSAHRPQASFLPLVEDNGQHPPAPQPSLIKTLEIIEVRGRSALV